MPQPNEPNQITLRPATLLVFPATPTGAGIITIGLFGAHGSDLFFLQLLQITDIFILLRIQLNNTGPAIFCKNGCKLLFEKSSP